MPKRSPASPSPSLSRPGHLEHWVVGQAGRLGAQEANPGQCGRPGLTESWKGKTSPSSAQADMQSFANGLTGPARSHSARDPLPALSLPLPPQGSQNSEMKPTWSPLSQRTEKRRHGCTHARTHALTTSNQRSGNESEGAQGSPQGIQRRLPARRAVRTLTLSFAADLTVPAEVHVYGNSTTPFRNPLKGICRLDALYKATVNYEAPIHARLC